MTIPIEYFLSNYRRPYSIEQVQSFLDAPMEDVKKAHEAAIACGLTREVEPGIFISLCARDISMSNPGWKYDHGVALAIIQELARKPAFSTRALAARLGRSHEYCCKYIAAMLAINAVTVRRDGYYPGTNTDLTNLGMNVPKRIIQKRRKKAGITNIPKKGE